MKNSALKFALVLMTLAFFVSCEKDVKVEPVITDTEQPESYLIAFYNPLDFTLFFLEGYQELVIDELSIVLSGDANDSRNYIMPVMAYNGTFESRNVSLQPLDSFALASVVTELSFILEEIMQSPEPVQIDRNMELLNNAECVSVGASEGYCHVIGNESTNNYYWARRVCRDGIGTCPQWRERIGTHKRFRSTECTGTVSNRIPLYGFVCE